MKDKKAILNYTKEGYSYIKCTKNDCFEWGGAAICDSCGEQMQNDVYLIFILGQAFCPDCFMEWKERSHRYEEDIKLQNARHLYWYNAHGFEIINHNERKVK